MTVALHTATPAHRRKRDRPLLLPVIVDPWATAAVAGLRYISDTEPGIQRRKAGRGFTYILPDGSRVKDRDTLKRIESLVIPPAWTGVWICLDPHGHIQACGRDKKNYKQYKYHPEWARVRGENKFNRMLAFGQALPAIRRRAESDLALRGLPRDKVLAVVIHLLQTTLIRVGNQEYVKSNESFGLTTIRDEHVRIKGQTMCFEFKGKSNKYHTIKVQNPRLARIVKQCQDIPGHELFQYVDDEGQTRVLDSGDVNRYLREITGQDFTAKDFRTWGGTLSATLALQACGVPSNATEGKKNLVLAIKGVARRLGNTPATCRKYYIHPLVLDAYTAGTLPCPTDECPPGIDSDLLQAEERLLLRMLETYMTQKVALD